MTDRAIRVVPAGWYEDPADPDRVRWWNGVGWTEHTERKPGAQSTAGQAAPEPAPAPEPARAATEPESTHGSAPPPPLTRRQVIEAEGGNPAPEAPRATTAAAWLAALIPIVSFALAIGGLYLFFYVQRTPLIALIALAPYLLGVLAALADGRWLSARGLRPPSPLWALLTPLGYLVARRARVPGNGPLLLFVVATVVTIAAPAAIWASGGARMVTLALDVQQTAVSRLVDTGRLQSVSCPPFVESTAPGALFTCQATTSGGLPTEVWVSIDARDDAFSLAPAL
jgi:hypothetical protein